MKRTKLRGLQKWLRQNWAPVVIILIGLSSAFVIMILPKQADEDALQSTAMCEGTDADDFGCWSRRYSTLTKQEDIKTVFADLRGVYADNTYVQSQCHQITHVIGRVVAETAESVGKAYQQGDSFCWSGFYHGVIEQVAKNMGKDEFIAQLNTLCADVEAESRYSFYHYNCVHGLGHGVMSISDNELFESLQSCKSIIDNWNMLSCVGGVFMENVMSDPATNPTHTTNYLRPSEPMYPCTAVASEFKEQCYLMQTSYALRQVGQDFARGFELCAAVDSGFSPTCYQSLGRDASGNSVSNVASTIRNCELGTSYEQQANCAIGAVKDFISYHSDDVQAKVLCDSFSDGAVKSICHQTATEYYRSF